MIQAFLTQTISWILARTGEGHVSQEVVHILMKRTVGILGTFGCYFAMFLGAAECLLPGPELRVLSGMWQIISAFLVIITEAASHDTFLNFCQKLSYWVNNRPNWNRAAVYCVVALPGIILNPRLRSILGGSIFFATGLAYAMLSLAESNSVIWGSIKKTVVLGLVQDQDKKSPTTDDVTRPEPLKSFPSAENLENPSKPQKKKETIKNESSGDRTDFSATQTSTNPIGNNRPWNEVTGGIVNRTQDKVAILVSAVKDILCHLGEGFIEKCLMHYNYDVAAVINAVLENSLPQNLKRLDRTLPYIPPDPEAVSAAIDRVLGHERLNVFDNDEFDVMTRDVIDQSRVHKGKKKDEYKNFKELMNDKSHLRETSNIYQKYSIVCDESDDEFYDTYGDHKIVRNQLRERMGANGRDFTIPRVLIQQERPEVKNKREAVPWIVQREGPSRDENNRCNFVEDPAVLRARVEQRRRSNWWGEAEEAGKKSRADVNDILKGQDDKKKLLIARDHKNTNKVFRNHNRRNDTAVKQRQGMIP